MVDENYGFRDDEERKAFYIALPVLALFGGLLYYFVFTPEDTIAIDSAASGDAAFLDSDADGIADHLDRCVNEKGSLDNHGCLLAQQKDKEKTAALKQQPTANSVSRASKTTTAQLVEEPTAETVELIEPAIATPTPTANEIVRSEVAPTPAPIAEPTPTPEEKPAPVVDSDADGFNDADDPCPNIAGADNGCPIDTDADGVTDDQDQCPDIAAGTDNGCPTDKDNDGVPDESDACPETFGTDKGCPADTDSDGFPDDVDACPETVGTDKGCPADKDADGIPDNEDKCPDTAGTNNGCPAQAAVVKLPKDMDIDGIADKDDKCPDIAGSKQNAGCPESTTIALTPEKPVTESEERLIQDAGFNIQFNAGNSVLTGRSREILLEVAKVMKRYPNIRLEAHGFTDAEGSTAANKNLSQQRAQSCVDVISKAGIDRERLKALGFGEAQPIASNSTAVGRQKNRRVEFKLIR